MGSDRSVPCCTRKILSILVRDMFALAILVALGKTEINDVHGITSMFSGTDKEVIWLDVTMNDSFVVDLCHMTYKLNCNHKHCLEI